MDLYYDCWSSRKESESKTQRGRTTSRHPRFCVQHEIGEGGAKKECVTVDDDTFFFIGVGKDGFEPPKAYASRFTVCPIWPLWYLPKPFLVLQRKELFLIFPSVVHHFYGCDCKFLSFLEFHSFFCLLVVVDGEQSEDDGDVSLCVEFGESLCDALADMAIVSAFGAVRRTGLMPLVSAEASAGTMASSTNNSIGLLCIFICFIFHFTP